MFRRGRRLAAVLLAAAHRACDGGRLEVATELLRISEAVIATEADLRLRRHDIWALVAAHERLWHLRHGEGGPAAG